MSQYHKMNREEWGGYLGHCHSRAWSEPWLQLCSVCPTTKTYWGHATAMHQVQLTMQPVNRDEKQGLSIHSHVWWLVKMSKLKKKKGIRHYC